ncbi:PdaC/SigV domain-containing protein [Novosphingobium aquimarinum]|uniref:PdaC/SigV domain-containing protein n=1 Tax=Novosphingobium aquimarinum TaxID=2682494 RepID=UPI0018DE22A0|nr:DUF4163 domain-containing protein [Novosphingobium aquimarinum]
MRSVYGLVSIAVVASLSACQPPVDDSGAEPTEMAQTKVIEEEPSSDSDAATFDEMQVSDLEGIKIPTVSGIETAAADRINTALTSIRQSAVKSATECKAAAGSNPFTYELSAEPGYNADNVLSLRMTGHSFCGGANGSTLVDARTFDLTTGEEIDVVKASGMSSSELLKASAKGYAGDGNCKDFVDSNIGTDQVEINSAFVTKDGIGVNYDINVGAAESCAADAGNVAWTALGDGTQIAEPLRTIAARRKK